MVRLAGNSSRNAPITQVTKPSMPQIAWNDLVPLPDHPELQTPVKPTDADQELVMTTNPGSDWWHTPDAHRSTAPILGIQIPAELAKKNDWEVGVGLAGVWVTQFDQAGLFFWQSDKSWIKTGIEFNSDKPWISAVVTNTYSDWSLIPTKPTKNFTHLKIKRNGTLIQIFAALDETPQSSGENLQEKSWTMTREVTNFPVIDGPEWIGIGGASPLADKGCEIRFEHFWVR